MKTVAYTPLHSYGKEYFRFSVLSVAEFVDKHIILYTPRPSYGHSTDLECPDTEEELRACVEGIPHVEWHTEYYGSEAQHRGNVMQFIESRDTLLIPIDADEVWHPVALDVCLKTVYSHNSHREWRLTGMVHLWRSFNWVCTDQMAPVRFVDLRHSGGHNSIHGRLYHFGYAQSVEITRYKWAIHGHKPELRKNWLEEKFINWKPGMGDVHPTCSNTWFPRPFKKSYMPLFLRFHPYYGLDLIE